MCMFICIIIHTTSDRSTSLCSSRLTENRQSFIMSWANRAIVGVASVVLSSASWAASWILMRHTHTHTHFTHLPAQHKLQHQVERIKESSSLSLRWRTAHYTSQLMMMMMTIMIITGCQHCADQFWSVAQSQRLVRCSRGGQPADCAYKCLALSCLWLFLANLAWWMNDIDLNLGSVAATWHLSTWRCIASLPLELARTVAAASCTRMDSESKVWQSMTTSKAKLQYQV